MNNSCPDQASIFSGISEYIENKMILGTSVTIVFVISDMHDFESKQCTD